MNTLTTLLAGLLLSAPALADHSPNREPHPDDMLRHCPHHEAKTAHFRRADLDGDHRISREEHTVLALKLSEQRFTRADTNADGYLSHDEAQAAFAKHARGAEVRMKRCRDQHDKGVPH